MDRNSVGGSSDGAGEIGSASPPGFVPDAGDSQPQLINPPTNQKPPTKTEVVVSFPGVIKKHELTNAEIGTIAKGARSRNFDIFLAAIFAGGASLLQGIERFGIIMDRQPPWIGPLDIGVIVVPVVSLIVALLFGLAWRGEKDESSKFIEDLDKRPTRPGK